MLDTYGFGYVLVAIRVQPNLFYFLRVVAVLAGLRLFLRYIGCNKFAKRQRRCEFLFNVHVCGFTYGCPLSHSELHMSMIICYDCERADAKNESGGK